MITMRDIAVRAGVSRSTVSFVLNDKHDTMGVNEQTRRRVLQVAHELGYRRNELARAIVTGKIPVFGFLVWGPMLESEVAARVLSGVLDEAESHRYTVQVIRLTSTDGDPISERDKESIRRCLELRPTGVMGIYVSPEILAHLRNEMERFSIPIAVLDSTRPLSGASHILSDDVEGCRQAIKHLASLGHRRIAYIGGNPESVAGQLREQGYRQAMAEEGLTILPGYRESGCWRTEQIEDSTRHLFRQLPAPPTALFCADDRTAMVACRVLRELGRRVPEDISVVGFADLGMATYSDPPLTTVAQPFQEMGRRAVRRLLAAAREKETREEEDARDPDYPDYEERLPTRLIVRRSTAPPADRG